MKINDMETIALSLPLPIPFSGPGSQFRKTINPVLARLSTVDGLEAFGVAFTSNDQAVKSLKTCMDDLKPVIIGQDIFRLAEAWQKLWAAIRHMGRQGYGIYALSTIDMALWCLQAKAFGVPLARLLGGFREKIPVYASHMLFRDWSIDRLQKDAESLVDQGFRALKMNMGDKPAEKEIERLKAVREAVGDDIDILIDVNWEWSISKTIQIGRELEPYRVFWLEDPLLSDDADDLAKVADALDLPIAAGETFSNKHGFRPLLEKRSADILIVDIMRVGGVTEWMKVAAMAQAWNLPVASHLFHDFSAHLIAAVPNGLIVEYMPWWDAIYKEPPKIEDGCLSISNKPGLGLDLNPEIIKKYQIS